jgi:hypothetical protein
LAISILRRFKTFEQWHNEVSLLAFKNPAIQISSFSPLWHFEISAAYFDFSKTSYLGIDSKLRQPIQEHK